MRRHETAVTVAAKITVVYAVLIAWGAAWITVGYVAWTIHPLLIFPALLACIFTTLFCIIRLMSDG